MCIIIKEISELKFSSAHGGSGRKREIINGSEINNENLEILNKDYLSKGKIFDWHMHENADEIALVLEGKGIIYYIDENHQKNFSTNDVIVFEKREMHKIKALSNCKFYFLRIIKNLQ